MKKLTIDLESRSVVDLPKTNPWVYAEHPSTQIMCFAFKAQGEQPQMWIPPDVRDLYDLEALYTCPDFHVTTAAKFQWALDDADIIEAHNLEFEMAMWTHIMHGKYGLCDLREEPYFSKLRCSASVAAAHALPRSLGGAGSALGLDTQKDQEGHKLMLKLCKPRKPRKAEREANPIWSILTYFHGGPEDFLRQAQYCAQDVVAEEMLSDYLGDLPPEELAVWRIDQKANWRGVVVDQDLCHRIKGISDEYISYADQEFNQITGLGVNQTVAFAQWCTNNGVPMDSVLAANVDETLANGVAVPHVRRALELRRGVAKTSLSKVDKAIRCTSADGRMRSNLMYHGASTGRWTGKGMQLQNLPSRGLIDNISECTDLILHGADLSTLDALYPDVQLALSSCIRGVIRPSEGNVIYSADFKSIEGRVLAWLAEDNHIVQGYIDGLDMYKIAAAGVYRVPYEEVTKEQRSVGKIPELGGGYGGGWRAYMQFAKDQGLKTPPEIVSSLTDEDMYDYGKPLSLDDAGYRKWFSPIVESWRSNRPGTVRLWRQIEEAIRCAIRNPLRVVSYAGISYGVNKRGWLKCLLPSGRTLVYHQPRLVAQSGRKDQITYYGVDSVSGRWCMQYLYGGKAVENIVQAIARDLMRDAMLRIDKEDLALDLLFTVHDEIVEEGRPGVITQTQYEDLMSIVPDWATGCPIEADGWIGDRYRK